MSRPRKWTDEELNEMKFLLKSGSSSIIGNIFKTTKNSILGALYRDKIKNGYVPSADSKYTSKKNRRGVKRTLFREKIGERNCNVCQKKFDMHGKYDRFCHACRRNLPYA